MTEVQITSTNLCVVHNALSRSLDGCVRSPSHRVVINTGRPMGITVTLCRFPLRKVIPNSVLSKAGHLLVGLSLKTIKCAFLIYSRKRRRSGLQISRAFF